MFVNHDAKILISVPSKCGTYTFAHLLKGWQDVYTKKSIDNLPYTGLQKTLAACDKLKINFDDYTHYVVVRHPHSWLMSGFRFLQSFGGNPRHFKYHRDYEAHLTDVLAERTQNITVFNLFWSEHCSVMPDKYCDKNGIPVKLENIDDFFKTLNVFNTVPIKNVTSPRIPYPIINSNIQSLLNEISEDYAKKFGYTL